MLTCLEGPAFRRACLGSIPRCIKSGNTDQVLGETGQIFEPDARIGEEENLHFFSVILTVFLPIINLVGEKKEISPSFHTPVLNHIPVGSLAGNAGS